MTPRPLTSDEARLFGAARTVALESMPYFASALFAVTPLATTKVATMAVDAHWRLYLNIETMRQWGAVASGAVLLHEVNHLLRDHSARAKELGVRDHGLWNLCADAAINHTLLSARVPLPDGCITPQTLGQHPGRTEEIYYRALLDSPTARALAEANAASGDEAPYDGCGSGAGDPIQPWEAPVTAPYAPAMSEPAGQMVRRAVAQDVRDAAPGTVGEQTARWAEETLTASSIPWTTILAQTLARAARLVAGTLTHTYTRPSRHPDRRIILPARRSPRLNVAQVIDTSASMSANDLSEALAEVGGVLRAVGGRSVVFTCDAFSSEAQRVTSASAVRLVGGGGTDMRVGIAAAEKAGADVTVVFTDGETPWPDRPTRSRLIVVLTRRGRGALHEAYAPPFWATVLAVS